MNLLHSPPQHLRSVRRIGEVVGVLAKHRLAEWLSQTEFDSQKSHLTGGEGELPAKQSHATRIRLAVTELGTTYIKFGQMLSTRPDLVGQEVADELAKLQDGVPPDEPEVALASIATELGRPENEIFARDERIRPRLSWGSGNLNWAIVARQVNSRAADRSAPR